MSVKTYIAKIGLVLADANGGTFRVAAGAAVDLTEQQYREVATYVDEARIGTAALAASGYQADGVTPIDADDAQAASKSRRSNKSSADAVKD